MKIIETLIISLLIMPLAGCSSIQRAIAADSITTFAGLSTKGAIELNPILPTDAMGAALTSGLLKHIALEVAKKQPATTCIAMTESLFSISWGAAANNLVAMAGATAPLSLTVGLIAALTAHQHSIKPALTHCMESAQ